MIRKTLALGVALLAISFAASIEAHAQVTGRIAISSDGNKHDCDDLLASAVSVAILAKTGHAAQLRYYGYADHIWATSSGCEGGNREDEMRISSRGTAELWGGFDLSVFHNARADTTNAVQRLVDQINASSLEDPLWIIAAGPMEVVGRAIDKSDGPKRQFVTVISHSTWNDEHADDPDTGESHSGWTWKEISDLRPAVKMIHLQDQNHALYAAYDKYFSWRDSNDPKLRWLWDRSQKTGVNWFDCSDAGMVYWLVNGHGSDDELTPAELLALFSSGSGGGGGGGGGDDTSPVPPKLLKVTPLAGN